MATTSYARSDALTVEKWAKRLSHTAGKGTEIAPLMGENSQSIIHVKNEIKSGGDKVTIGLRARPTGDGTSSTQTLEGNEEALTTHSDSLVVDELNHAMRVKGNGTISQQRVLFNMRDEARMGLSEWFADRYSISFFNQMCGYTPANDQGLLYTGLNAVLAPSSDRHIWTESGTTADEDLDSTDDEMTLQHISYAKEKAMTADTPIRPIMVNGAKKFVCYLHPYQVVDLKIAAQASGAISWADIQLAALSAKDSSKNPIYTGAIGEFDGVILREANDITKGVNSSTGAAVNNVRRAVFMGAQAACAAWGKERSASSKFKWKEEEFDYGRELGVSGQTIFGLKKTRFNGSDFGTIVISSYAVAHG
ncbi:MAG: N4-gp56 family major capsid protein [Pseudomonadota bacterium]